MSELEPIIAAFAGGVLPALAWLWFWRREDSVHPEPRRLIALAFLAGMVAVAVVIPIEKMAASYLKGQDLFVLTAARTLPLLFLLSPLSGDTLLQTVLTGNLRFVGATLLHVLSSAVIGVFLGLSFYKSRFAKRWYVLAGVILASLLHSTFNFLILNTPEEHLLRTFGLVWIGLIALLAVLEYIKRIHPVIKKTVWRS